jgi:hypothetical protein
LENGFTERFRSRGGRSTGSSVSAAREEREVRKERREEEEERPAPNWYR